MRSIRIQTLSRPGKDILYGVDAFIRDSIVDPMRLTIGCYNYGAYSTNWIITQTTRFNAALSGLYEKEAAIFQIDKVRTPTHIVVPGGDNRVSSAESFILEQALTSLGIPTKLLTLPGEPHTLGNNPWHEKIKLREELKWLQKYGNIN